MTKSSPPLDPARHQAVVGDPRERVLVQGVHFNLTAEQETAIIDKFAPLLRHEERMVRVNVRVHRDQTLGQKSNFSATAQLEVSGPDVVAHAAADEPLAAIDLLVEKLDRLLERRHDRRKDRRNHPQPLDLNAPLPKAPQ